MPQVAISDEVYARIMAFKPLLECVLQVSLEPDPYAELLLRLAPDLILGEFFAGADGKNLFQLLLQLGQDHPETYAAIAQVLDRNQAAIIEAEKRSSLRQNLGFPEPAA